MATRFATSTISNPSFNLYTIEKFNGVDYTTTPTLVDYTRAIDMSNYLPYGNSLVKRNGWELVTNSDRFSKIYEFKKFTKSNGENFYILIATNKSDEITWIYNITDLEGFAKNDTNSYNWARLPENGAFEYNGHLMVEYENKIFLLISNHYYVFDKNLQFNGTNFIDITKKENDSGNNNTVAYVPTVYVGLNHYKNIRDIHNLGYEFIDNENVSYKLFEPFNRLSHKIKVELYLPTTDIYLEHTDEFSPEDYYLYDLRALAPEGKRLILTPLSEEEQKKYGISNIELSHNGALATTLNITDDNVLIINKNTSDEKRKSRSVDLTIELEIEDYDLSFIPKMRFGVSYGYKGYQDRLFLSGNPDFPNVDIHSEKAYFAEERWKDYTYFPDTNYQAFGGSDSKITGYGFLPNGYMAIFKDKASNNEPNMYIRYGTMYQDSEGNYLEKYPIELSGLSIDNQEIGQVINYDNYLIVNTPSGIYQIVANESTATQTFSVKELSYFIRNNLSRDLTNSNMIVFKDKLYVTRLDINGNLRVYVADKDRYSFNEGSMIFEWCVLDDLNAYKMFEVNNEMYFANNRGLCKMTNDYVDKFSLTSNKTTDAIGVTLINDKKYLTINKQTVFAKELTDKLNYDNFMNYGKVDFLDTSNFPNNYLTYFDYPRHTSFDIENRKILFPIDDEVSNHLYECLRHGEQLKGEWLCVLKNLYRIEEIIVLEDVIEVIYDSFETSTKKFPYLNNEVLSNNYVYFYLETIQRIFGFDINELYAWDETNQRQIPYSKCINEDDKWIYVGNNNEEFYELPKDVLFGHIELKNKLGVFDLNRIVGTKDNINYVGTSNGEVYSGVLSTKFLLSSVNLTFVKPIKSYWYGKWENLGRLDVLKSANTIHFVPDFRFDGETRVGYRTSKTDIGYNSVVAPQGLDFQDIDFNYFVFGNKDVAKTYSSKKKIKNFSFIQLKIYSNDNRASSMVSISFRYKTTKINKGVK